MDSSNIERINSFLENMSMDESFIHPNTYILDHKLKIYEDEMHEFKQFSICDKTEVPERIRSLSKYLCAFLNSNSGVIYLGVNDDGYVKGIKLTKEVYELVDYELISMINSFDRHISQGEYIIYQFCPVLLEEYMTTSIIEGLYVIEIFVKVGLPDHIYTTPFKDPKTNDYQCFVKLNGTTKKIEGPSLYKYIKNKVRNYILKSK